MWGICAKGKTALFHGVSQDQLPSDCRSKILKQKLAQANDCHYELGAEGENILLVQGNNLPGQIVAATVHTIQGEGETEANERCLARKAGHPHGHWTPSTFLHFPMFPQTKFSIEPLKDG